MLVALLFAVLTFFAGVLCCFFCCVLVALLFAVLVCFAFCLLLCCSVFCFLLCCYAFCVFVVVCAGCCALCCAKVWAGGWGKKIGLPFASYYSLEAFSDTSLRRASQGRVMEGGAVELTTAAFQRRLQATEGHDQVAE